MRFADIERCTFTSGAAAPAGRTRPPVRRADVLSDCVAFSWRSGFV
jgi:hypothetical protein